MNAGDDPRPQGHADERESAAIGVFLTLEEPTKPMRDEAATAGAYHSELSEPRLPAHPDPLGRRPAGAQGEARSADVRPPALQGRRARLRSGRPAGPAPDLSRRRRPQEPAGGRAAPSGGHGKARGAGKRPTEPARLARRPRRGTSVRQGLAPGRQRGPQSKVPAPGELHPRGPAAETALTPIPAVAEGALTRLSAAEDPGKKDQPGPSDVGAVERRRHRPSVLQHVAEVLRERGVDRRRDGRTAGAELRRGGDAVATELGGDRHARR